MAIYEKHGSFYRGYSTGEMKSNLVLHSYLVCHNINNNTLKKDGGARVIFSSSSSSLYRHYIEQKGHDAYYFSNLWLPMKCFVCLSEEDTYLLRTVHPKRFLLSLC